MEKKKIPFEARSDASRRVPNGAADAKSPRQTDGVLLAWSFDMIDRDGKFRFVHQDLEGAQAKKLLGKVVEFSQLTWSEIKSAKNSSGRNKHHFLSYESLSPDAKKRFSIRKFDQNEYHDQLFSLALENKLRIIGIRDGNVFHPIWYDPEHQVCPSRK